MIIGKEYERDRLSGGALTTQTTTQNKTTVEREVPGSEKITQFGFGCAMAEVTFTGLYLLGIMASLSLLQEFKPPDQEWFILVALTIILLERFAVTFTRLMNPKKFYETEVEVEEIEVSGDPAYADKKPEADAVEGIEV